MGGRVAFNVPLGIDLAPREPLVGASGQNWKEDPTLVVHFLNIRGDVAEDTDAHAKMEKAVYAINSIPGSFGKIAASLERMGHGTMSHAELLKEVNWTEDKSFG